MKYEYGSIVNCDSCTSYTHNLMINNINFSGKYLIKPAIDLRKLNHDAHKQTLKNALEAVPEQEQLPDTQIIAKNGRIQVITPGLNFNPEDKKFLRTAIMTVYAGLLRAENGDNRL